LKKAVELFEQLQQRTGVVVVGPSGCGKSTLWRLLHHALTHSSNEVHVKPKENQEPGSDQVDQAENNQEPESEDKTEELQKSSSSPEEVLKIVLHTVNPKAITRTQLLGNMDPDTREWSDGVLTKSARAVVALPKGNLNFK
jgi:dynein heavy chain 2